MRSLVVRVGTRCSCRRALGGEVGGRQLSLTWWRSFRSQRWKYNESEDGKCEMKIKEIVIALSLADSTVDFWQPLMANLNFSKPAHLLEHHCPSLSRYACMLMC